MKEFMNVLPKGKERQVLVSQKRIQKVKLFRMMTTEEVKDSILCCSFSGIMKTNQFIAFQCASGSTLQQAKSQELTAEVAIERRGALYLCEVSREPILQS